VKWKTYSIEDDEHTWGYTILLPLSKIEKSGGKYRYQGWTLFTNDGGRAIDSKYGKFSINAKDEEGEEVYIEEISKPELGDRWIADYVIHQMIRDCFEGDINKYNIIIRV